MTRRRSGLFAALLLAGLAATAMAQDLDGFADPLEHLRPLVERAEPAEATETGPKSSPAPRPRVVPEPAKTSSDPAQTALERLRADGAASLQRGTERANDVATGVWGRLKAAVDPVAESLGLGTTGFLGLLGTVLTGLALLIGWSLFRGSGGKRRDPNLYASGSTAERRRTLDRSTNRRNTGPASDERLPLTRTALPADGPADTVTTDPATWRKPNLDRLRDSIRDDWTAAKRAESHNHGDSAFPPEETLETMLDDAPQGMRAAEDRPLSEIGMGWDEWDAGLDEDQTVWGERAVPAQDGAHAGVTAEEALRRVRALRESLAVS